MQYYDEWKMEKFLEWDQSSGSGDQTSTPGFLNNFLLKVMNQDTAHV